MTNLKPLKRLLPFVLVLGLVACGDEQAAGTASPDPAGSSNAPPVIDGEPLTTAVVGQNYDFVPAASDADDDVLTFTIENRPGWAVFSPSTGRLSGRPPASAASRVYEDIRISVSDSKAVAELPAYDLEVEADSDANSPPVISGSPVTTATVGNSYSFTPDASDPDGQVLAFSIESLPAWANFDALTGEISGTPGIDDVATFGGIVISVSDGVASRSLPAFAIVVSAGAPPPPVNSPPVISGSPAQAVTVGNVYSFRPTASDPDGQALTFSISGKPDWASFNTGTGRLSGTPSGAGTHAGIQISVTDGAASASLPAFTLTVVAANSPPQIGGTPATRVTAGQAYSFQPSASDPDDQSLSFSISNRPGWATFSTQTGRLSGTPDGNNVGSYNNVRISVTDGIAVSSLPVFSILVDAANRPPVISGSPVTTATTGLAYAFQPTASDPDGDSLTFAISNKPSWASFNTSTGRLSGTPSVAATHSGIVISASDGSISASLAAFAISVAAVAPTNRAPVISGSPATSITVGQAYSFQPTASDPDGDDLTFTVQNLPVWASFNAATGRLSGTPQAGDANTYTGIRITVSDGTLSASLGAFSITVQQVQLGSATLSWTPPTQNEDGTPLTDLRGFRVYYGTSSSALSTMNEIPNAGITSAVIEDLAPATWYFTVRAYTTDGVESSSSNVVSKRID